MKEKNNNLNSLTKNRSKKEEKKEKNKGSSSNLQKLKLKKKLDFINFRFYFRYISHIFRKLNFHEPKSVAYHIPLFLNKYF